MFKVIHHFEGRNRSMGTIEERLNSLEGDDWQIMSVMCVRYEFIRNGSNHGHGGYIEAHYVIVARHA